MRLPLLEFRQPKVFLGLQETSLGPGGRRIEDTA
jgi:hypothetical protein